MCCFEKGVKKDSKVGMEAEQGKETECEVKRISLGIKIN